jgi:Leucine-rich repeat (LRR) protein
MSNKNFVRELCIAAIFTFSACTTKTAKPDDDLVRNDTKYTSSTELLMSDEIPDSIFQFTELRHLTITGMDCDYGNKANCWMIKKIPQEIRNFKKLTTLRLTVGGITDIPKELAELENLTLIDLTDNAALTDVSNLTGLQNLQYLYLYGCGLTKLPENIGKLSRLKELGLVGNRIDKAEQVRVRKVLPNCDIKF